MGIMWQCDRCEELDQMKPWDCPVCNKETCAHCFTMYAVCDSCAKGKTPEEIEILSGIEWD
tara:strand:+ start:2274 stop:2456 length:183 start_codon:yes stop_codon:yes gene_type:complete